MSQLLKEAKDVENESWVLHKWLCGKLTCIINEEGFEYADCEVNICSFLGCNKGKLFQDEKSLLFKDDF